jgi:predicted Zn-dependent protease
MAYLNEMIGRNPNSPELFVRRATLYMDAKDNARAQLDLDAALKLTPQSNTVKMTQANFYLKTNRPQDAITKANEIVKDNEEFIGAYYIMGSAYYNLAQYAQAVKTFNLILEKEKENKEAMYNIGLSYIRLNNSAEGCKYLRQAKQLNMTGADNLINQYCN